MSAEAGQFDLTPLSVEQFCAREAALSEDERSLLLGHAEEAPFSGIFVKERRAGVYCCRLCGLPLFNSDAKFESGTGWPSFSQPFHETHLRNQTDSRFGMVRAEVVCARCGSHQGHVFPDGPLPSGDRYCINSGSLEFTLAGEPLPNKLERGPPEGEPHNA